jgi:hypothetical protein
MERQELLILVAVAAGLFGLLAQQQEVVGLVL